ncbi:hypothetical protein DLAC_06588 [Tieghemostelium lacteum]|uniref:F-box domain-containing protein n=1 Tax=Tieghemostelium lacteum TaxID=361077 RepID=A0A151ZF52_TIELA|nr:hypothetical protein DLAC_06588 [Tieghemostelium lacteum]|eukprot:KYQ92596.1 hypothetical protein DLAC_06588 [Tieghemostelium lacteum]
MSILPRYLYVKILKCWGDKATLKTINNLTLVCKEWNDYVIPIIREHYDYCLSILDSQSFDKFYRMINTKGFRLKMVVQCNKDFQYQNTRDLINTFVDFESKNLVPDFGPHSPTLKDIRILMNSSEKCNDLSPDPLMSVHLLKNIERVSIKLTSTDSIKSFEFSSQLKSFKNVMKLSNLTIDCNSVYIKDIDTLLQFKSLAKLSLTQVRFSTDRFSELIGNLQCLSTVELRDIVYDRASALNDLFVSVFSVSKTIKSLTILDSPNGKSEVYLESIQSCLNENRVLKNLNVQLNVKRIPTPKSPSTVPAVPVEIVNSILEYCTIKGVVTHSLWKTPSSIKSLEMAITATMEDKKPTEAFDSLNLHQNCQLLKLTKTEFNNIDFLIGHIKLPNLRNLVLNRPIPSTDVSIYSTFSESLLRLVESIHTIRDLKLDSITIEGNQFVQFISKCTLERLSIHTVTWVGKTPKIWPTLTPAIVNHPTLGSLSINRFEILVRESIDTFIESITKIIKEGTNLYYLSLPAPKLTNSIVKDKVKPETLESFKSAIHQNYQNLDSLILNISNKEINEILSLYALRE